MKKNKKIILLTKKFEKNRIKLCLDFDREFKILENKYNGKFFELLDIFYKEEKKLKK